MFFFFLFFSSTNQKTGWWNRSCPGRTTGTSGRGEVTGKGGRRVKKCVHMYVNAKDDTCSKYSRNRGAGRKRLKENCGLGEFKYGMFDTL
jgi:hypothetical protein